MDEMDDIYKEYPELRDIKPRRASGGSKKKKGGMSNGQKLAALIAVLAAAAVLAAVVLPKLASETAFVYGKDGSVLEIKADELEKYLSDGYYANAADLAPIKMYAHDGTVITARAGDTEKLEKKGYTADKSAAYTNMYGGGGETLFVPNSMADSYKAKGWSDKLSDVVTTLYKEDGSKITVPKERAEEYLSKGWNDKIFSVAKKMTGPGGEEKIVFNKEVDEYLDRGWTVVKRPIDPEQPMLALTFDDGPGKYTDALLDCLDKNNCAATFFVLGNLLENFPETVKRADEIGCEIGSHTWDHTNLTTLSAADAASAVNQASEAVQKITGKAVSLYRPPYGACNETVLSAVDMPAIMWSVDTLDWKTKNADSTYKKIMDNARDGAIFLMHDIHQPTVEAACRAIPELARQGYQLVTVSELLQYRYEGGEGGKSYSGK